MIKLILGIIIGALLYHYYPSEVTEVIEQAEQAVQEAKKEVHDATRPDSKIEQIQNLVK